MFLLSYDGVLNGKPSFVEEMPFATPEAAMQHLVDGGFGDLTPDLHDDQTGETYRIEKKGDKFAFIPSGKDIFLVPMAESTYRPGKYVLVEAGGCVRSK